MFFNDSRQLDLPQCFIRRLFSLKSNKLTLLKLNKWVWLVGNLIVHSWFDATIKLMSQIFTHANACIKNSDPWKNGMHANNKWD